MKLSLIKTFRSLKAFVEENSASPSGQKCPPHMESQEVTRCNKILENRTTNETFEIRIPVQRHHQQILIKISEITVPTAFPIEKFGSWKSMQNLRRIVKNSS